MKLAQSILAAFRKRSALAAAYETIYHLPQGRMVIEDLLKKSGILDVCHVMGDPGTSAFNNGRRSIGLEIMDAMRWSEGKLIQLAKEQTSERASAAAEQLEESML